MKVFSLLKKRLSGLTDAIARYPLTSLFLLAAVFINAFDINITEKDYQIYLFTMLIGAFLSALVQAAYERWYSKGSSRFLLMGLAILLTAGYYLIVKSSEGQMMELSTRTYVALFALLIAFILIPVIKSEISFNKSFMVSFKSFFISLFFSGVMFAGISIIITAADQLIFTIDPNAYSHTANIIFLLFAPMYFLSLIPIFPGKSTDGKVQENMHETIKRAANCPKFLEILLSYIIIPLTTLFTLILLVYMFQNIRGEFWTDNLLEPMLVAYAVTVILVNILVSEIENKFTIFFRKVFPKLLIPIVIFQIIASYITLTDTGITHTRYYVILFGIFAVISGVLMSFFSVRKNGIVAGILIIFSAVSIIPPVDAFTISEKSQINTLEDVLVKNGMLKDNVIIPNASIPDEDKEKITNTIQYIWMMNYHNDLSYFPKDFNAYEDFYNTFGFDEEIDSKKFNNDQYVFVSMKQPSPINITGNDFFIQLDVYSDQKVINGEEQYEIEKDGKKYLLLKEKNKDQVHIKLLDENKKEILVFKTEEIFDKFSDVKGEKFITAEEATFTKENGQAKISYILLNMDIQKQSSPPMKNAIGYVLIQIK